MDGIHGVMKFNKLPGIDTQGHWIPGIYYIGD